MTVYRIRHKKTGLWSKGGYWPRWSNKGKVWRSSSSLGGHLAMFYRWDHDGSRTYAYEPEVKDWEIVEYIIQESEGKTVGADDYIAERFPDRKIADAGPVRPRV